MSWEVHVSGSARKSLKRFPAQERKRILGALAEFRTNPYAGDIEKIKGERRTWRRRVGNYRILYDISATKQLVEVRKISRRTSTTY